MSGLAHDTLVTLSTTDLETLGESPDESIPAFDRTEIGAAIAREDDLSLDFLGAGLDWYPPEFGGES